MSFSSPELDYFVRSFHPGYMDSPEPDTIPLGGTPDAKNCLFSSLQLGVQYGYGSQGHPPRAVLDKRTGARILTPSKVDGASGFDGLFEFRKVGQTAGRVVAVLNGKAWYWDNVSAFVQIGATAPFAVGTKVHFFVFRNLLFIMDGTTMKCWDGVLANDLFTPGQIGPTAAGALTTSAGPGVTGTYEGYQVWYDSAHDHESSPSATLTAQVVLANQTRNWAKPAGAPGANYDKWRIYCRRVDTNENYFWRVGEVAIGTVTYAETMTDAARLLSTLGPLPLQNDPPPLTFVFQLEFQGYRLGVVANDDQVYVSKLGDPQSQYPTDIIGVSRGTGGELRSGSKFGTEAVLQKASKTYRLKGDRMPYIPEEVHSTFGNVGAQSAVEVKGQFFAWDEDKGPYWTDLQSNWEPIGTARIARIVANVPKTLAPFIECVHLKSKNLVIWSAPQGASTRRRTLIAWHTELQSWLPPITGLEYACLATLIDTTGTSQLYVGDYWGRLFQYFTDNVEGVPSGSLLARVLSSASGSVTCDNALTINSSGAFVTGAAVAFYTTGAGLTGLPVLHIDANGNHQWRRIQSNTGAVITLDTTNDSAWSTLPVAGDTIVVGGIDWYFRMPLVDFGDPFRAKKGHYFAVQARPGSAGFRVKISAFKEGFSTREFAKTFVMTNTGGLWGSGLWGSMVWGGGNSDAFKTRIKRSFFSMAAEFSNPYPNNSVSLLGVRLTADWLRKRLRRSGGAL